MNHQTLLSEQGLNQDSKPTRQECVAEYSLKNGRYGHGPSTKGCRGSATDLSGGWEMVDGDEDEWTEVTKE